MANKPSNDPKLERLLELARKAPKEPSPMPPGLSTRVAARWAERPSAPSMLDLLERLGIWSLAGSVAICVLLAVMQNPAQEPITDELAFETLLFGEEEDAFPEFF